MAGMIKYPLAYNPILEYWEKIQDKEIRVSDKVFRTYKKVVKDIVEPGEYFYSAKRANHILEFAENYCRHSKGKFGGKPVQLELWEKAHLATVFGFVDIEGNRKYRESLLIVGKKNGKSLLASVVGLYMLTADGEMGPEVYAVATKKDQSKIIWLESKRMVRKSPSLSKRVRSLVAELDTDFNDGVFKPLASDSDTLDGLNIHCVLMDEIHQWKQGKALYDIMADGTSAREQPLVYITSTAGTIREDIYDQKYEEAEMVINGYEDPDGYKDEHFIAFIYELDNRKEWTDETCWEKANPGLGTIKNRNTLKDKVEKAKKNPLLVKNLLCKEFNIRETSSEAWLTFEQANNTAVFDIRELKPRYGIGGVDLSATTDLTAAKVLFKVPEDEHIYVMSMYWIPEDLVEKRVQEDKIPYDVWIEKGYVRTCPGNKISYRDVKSWFVEVQQEHDIYLNLIGYDSWSAVYFVEDMQDYFGKSSMVPVIQGKKTLSQPMKALGADLENNLIVYNNNPVDKWCLCNTAVDVDKNDNIQPIKGSKPRRRIDGTAALLDAYVVLQNNMNDYMSLI
ncbi:terminase large subunit [Blautia hominis]|uniref:Terminase large subunit n=1 Tax=Blautia hominis TaxID=2025493 RepID=A0ABQ0BGL5_9FIRM|nr:terminase TerL endonuclease subunit [Blautia sp. NSJ-175]MCJ7849240.1 terminase large subunit [Blautia sp. NSJ-175]